MHKITTHLWFDKEAKEAAKFYTSVFSSVIAGSTSKIIHSSTIEGTPSGSVDILTIQLLGEEFMLISAGPLFKFNPSVSFHVACKTKEQVDALWEKFSAGGMALMELGTYPFSERYGWVQDKYGLSWQLFFAGDKVPKEKITPVIMFIGSNAGRAEEAVNLYTSVFSDGGYDSKIMHIQRYGTEGQDKAGTVQYASFTLGNKEFGAMDSAYDHKFALNEAISFMVYCKNQKEIDYFWDKLIEGGGEESQCGWLKDKFGLSWQVVPEGMDVMMQTKDKKQLTRVTEAFLKMKKFDLATLQNAYDGK